MSHKDKALQTVQLCEQMIQQSPTRHLLHAYRSVVAVLRLTFLMQADSLDSTDGIVKALEDRCNSKQEIIHALEVYCVKNGLLLPIRSDDYQPDIEPPPTKH